MPSKIALVAKARELSDYWLMRLPWPNINPSLITGIAVPLSLVFVFLWDKYPFWAFLALSVSLVTDWLDGIIAKKYHRASEKGWLADVITDRICEGIIFAKFFTPWFYFFLFNILMTFLSYKLKKQMLILSLRHLFFLYLIAYHSFLYFYSR